MKFERIIVGSIFIIILFLLCSNYADNEDYYANSALNELFYNYPDNQIFVSGTVTDIFPDGFQVSTYNRKDTIDYRITTSSKVNLGDTVFVVGTSNSDVITSLKLSINSESDFNFVIVRSIIGLGIFLIFFGRYWKFDLKNIKFMRLKEKRACKSKRFAASKLKILTVFLNHQNQRFWRKK